MRKYQTSLFPRENEAVKHELVDLKVQCLSAFCCHGSKSIILLFSSMFRTTLEVSTELYFAEISLKVSVKLWLFNHKRAEFLASEFCIFFHFSASLRLDSW